MYQFKALKRIVSTVCILTVIGTSVLSVKADTDVSVKKSNNPAANHLTAGADLFLGYMDSYKDAEYPEVQIPFLTAPAIKLKAGESYSTDIEVANEGLYALSVTYKDDISSKAAPIISLNINGKSPYYEAERIGLMQTFRDAEDLSAKAPVSNLIPDQVQIEKSDTVFLTDTIGYYGGRLYFYLKKGVNEVSLTVKEGGLTLEKALFTQYNQAEAYSYDDVKSKGSLYDGKPYYKEAEHALVKSDSSVYAINDASSSAVSPCSPYSKYLNIIGGSSWQNIGQFIEWEIDVPKDALYSIAVKYCQDENIGVSSYRRILIDGEVPYAELEAYRFKYTTKYINEVLSANGEEMKFYLTKGKHIIRMEIIGGDLKEILPYLNDISTKLSDNYRKIVMVTGSDVDTLRDYKLDTVIPDVIEDLKLQRDRLELMMDKLQNNIDGGNKAFQVIGTLKEQLDTFFVDSYNITKALSSFRSNISALANWLVNSNIQPLNLDYIVLFGEDTDIKSAKPSFVGELKFQFLSFLHTFSDNYELSPKSSKNENSITVWMQGNATTFNIMNQLISNKFKAEFPNIDIDLKLVSASLLTAVVTGRGPDIALQQGSDTVMNYAFRNAVVPVNDIEGFDEVKTRFRDASFKVISYDGVVYGIPATQDFNIMFYRKDIISELGLELPNTWEDVIKVMSKLKKKNLEFGVNGMLNEIIYQNGAKIYNDDLTATALNSYEAIEAFNLYTSFFTEYGALISYDALNRFRTGEMPLVISSVSFCNSLKVLAPEISDKWGILPIPGIEKDGVIDRTIVTGASADIILNESKKEDCFKFLEWWSRESVQIDYSNKVETAIDQSARFLSANVKAFNSLGWSDEILKVIVSESDNIIGIEAVPGSYYLGRHMNNAFAEVVYNSAIPGDALKKYTSTIDSEIYRKMQQLGMIE